MTPAAQAKKIIAELGSDSLKMGDLKRRAKEIGKNHDLATELWVTGTFSARMVATLIFDGKLLTEEFIDRLASDILEHDADERNQLSDWLLANQLMKNKTIAALIPTWEKKPSPVLRRWFWYHQARLRWTGQTPPGNTAELVESLEREMATAEPDVQWAMNFCAGQIGIHEPEFRSRCVDLGMKLGLYKDEQVPKNCTPSYLPEFIRIEVSKRT